MSVFIYSQLKGFQKGRPTLGVHFSEISFNDLFRGKFRSNSLGTALWCKKKNKNQNQKQNKKTAAFIWSREMFDYIALQVVRAWETKKDVLKRRFSHFLNQYSVLHCKCLEYTTQHTIACSSLSETGGLQEIHRRKKGRDWGRGRGDERRGREGAISPSLPIPLAVCPAHFPLRRP